MKEGIAALIVAGLLGFGLGKITSVATQPVSITSFAAQTDGQAKIYAARLDKVTYEQLVENGKAAPCFCSKVPTGESLRCEHEEFYCDKNAAEECERRHKGYECKVATAPIVSRFRD